MPYQKKIVSPKSRVSAVSSYNSEEEMMEFAEPVAEEIYEKNIKKMCKNSFSIEYESSHLL